MNIARESSGVHGGDGHAIEVHGFAGEAGEMLALPALGVVGIIEIDSGLGGKERAERVAHNGEFGGVRRGERGLDRAWVWAVGNALGMGGERADFDTFARAKVAFDVVKDFVAIEIAVVVWDFDGLRVIVEKAGTE